MTLRQKARGLRRAGRVGGGALVAALACAVVAAGGTTIGGPHSHAATCITAAVAVIVFTALVRRVRFRAPSARVQRVSPWMAAASTLADVELVLALVAGCAAVITATGGLRSPVYPLLYGVIAFSATFMLRAAAVVAVLAALALEAAAAQRAGWPVAVVSVHAAFIAAAALMHVVFLRGLVARTRREHERRVVDELRRRGESVDQVRMLQSDNVVSAEAVAQGRTIQGLGIAGPHAIDTIVPAYLEAYRVKGQYSHYRG